MDDVSPPNTSNEIIAAFPRPPRTGNRAWITLITSTSYIPGVLLLAYSLRKHKSQYPLLILYTSSINTATSTALLAESRLSNFQLLKVENLAPPNAGGNLIAERFRDTWTKLRVFEMYGWDRLCWLDADMLIFKNVDAVFEIQLGPESERGRWIAANHVCVCNLDHDSWAPADWTRKNCAWTGSSHPTALTDAPPVPKSGTGKDTHRLLNGGLFLFDPSKELWEAMLHTLTTDTSINEFMFPDQDFLAYFFLDRWVPLPWHYNALKTWRYWHPEMWRDEEVGVLHYIVDKPWHSRVKMIKDGRDGINGAQVDGSGDKEERKKVAGYLGRDGETHGWWWDVYEEWIRSRADMGEAYASYAPTLMYRLCAKPLDRGNSECVA
jgi:inositol 3-alpha-galactosyltransferase